MSKLVALLMAAAFAFASAGSFAMSHGGAAEGEAKMEEAGDMADPCEGMEGEAKEECEQMKEEDEAMKTEHSDMKEEKKAE